jgi:nitrite reductase/ring-hydroxylating ferredoxin subunit
MPEFRAVLPAAQLPPGKAASVEIADGVYVALCNVGGTIHAVDGTCPHRAGRLGLGILRDCRLSCPDHDWTFDVTTGSLLTGAIRIRTYEVQVLDGEIRIR